MRDTGFPAVAGADGAAIIQPCGKVQDAARDEIFLEDCGLSRTRGNGAISIDYLLEQGWPMEEIGRRIPAAVKAWQRARDEATTSAITAPLVLGAIAAAPLFFAALALLFCADLTATVV